MGNLQEAKNLIQAEIEAMKDSIVTSIRCNQGGCLEDSWYVRGLEKAIEHIDSTTKKDEQSSPDVDVERLMAKDIRYAGNYD